MSKAIENLHAAQQRAWQSAQGLAAFPICRSSATGGRDAQLWFLPACQSLYLTSDGPVVTQGAPLASGTADVPSFDREALIRALRTDQAGESTFPEFLTASWRAGVVAMMSILPHAQSPTMGAMRSSTWKAILPST